MVTGRLPLRNLSKTLLLLLMLSGCNRDKFSGPNSWQSSTENNTLLVKQSSAPQSIPLTQEQAEYNQRQKVCAMAAYGVMASTPGNFFSGLGAYNLTFARCMTGQQF